MGYKRELACLRDRIEALESAVASGVAFISGPVVTTFNDARGSVGNFSYDETNFLMWMKVDDAPDTWVNWTVANE